MKTPKNSYKNAKTEAGETENQADPLIATAPWFSGGIGKVKNHILDKVVPKEMVPKVRMDIKNLENESVEEEAERIGRDDGGGSSDQHFFQKDCRDAYRRVITRVGKTISGIAAREKDQIDEVLKSKLPDMEEDVERSIDRNAVLKLMDAAYTMNKTEKTAAKFLHDRDLNLDSYEAQKGYDFTHWKFWLPLLVMVLIDFYANYIFLEGAEVVQKILYAIASVAVIFTFGYGASWLFKANSGIRVRDNKFRTLQKGTVWAGMAMDNIGFGMALLGFIFSRAGLGIPSAMEVLPKLAEAFLNNTTDTGLALLNVVFLFVAITTFRNAGWRIRNYRHVAKDRAKHTQEYKQIRLDLDNKARIIFDKAIDSIKYRQEESRKIELNWPTIKAVCDQVPNIHEEARNIIVDKYELSIKKYREGFEQGRIANSDIAKDLKAQIPHELRMDSKIEQLTGTGNSMQHDTVLQALRDIDFPNDIDDFKKKVDEWKNANNHFNKLSDFAQQQIEKQKVRIRQEGKDDGIQNLMTDNEQPVDER